MADNGFSSFNSGDLIKSLNDTQNKLQKNFAKLSSGKRINSAADDAAGLAIADALQSDAVVLRQANRNIGDAQSAIAITDGAIEQVGNITGRLQELATQASNGTLSDAQRSSLNDEFQALSQEAQRIGATTQFNGQSLLSGGSISVQAGGDSSSDSQVATNGINIGSLISSITTQAIDTASGAQNALAAVQNFASSLSDARGNLGAVSSRLEVASSNNDSKRINSVAAESRIRDADIAETTAENVALRVRQQANIATNAHSNLSTSRVLDLLK